MVRAGARVAASLISLLAVLPAAAQVAGENVNMVSGTQWPGGDPFLQRQNEPTMAVSSVNSQHLMAGANDYRSVDVPDPAYGKMAAGDAWLGVFKSLDGGQTWRSVLLPGYPQDLSADGLASPLKTTMVVPKTFNATAQEAAQIGKAVALPGSADPVMRAGTDGMFYYLGINFARDKSVSRLFVGRFIDLNNKENGDATAVQPGTGNLGSDPIKYLDTQVIARSTDLALNGGKQIFIDKPWMAVDVPRAGAGTCTVPDGMGGTRKILAGAIYVGWAQFAPGDVSSDIMLTSSADCGVHWAAPRKLNTVNSVLNQGVAIAIEPLSGRVLVAWRRVASGKQTDAIMATRSSARKKPFAAPRVVAKVVPFDLGGTSGQARTQTMPSMAISSDGTSSWVHLAWASRDGAAGPSRVWMTTAKIKAPPTGDQDADEPDSSEPETRVKWSAPVKVSVGTATAPPSAAMDDAGHTLTRGHQFMPALTASQGKVVLFYYDTRLDHTRRLYAPYAPTGGYWLPDARGKFYQEELAPLGDLSGSPDGAPAMVFAGGAQAADLEDAAMRLTRHTIDATVGFAAAGPAPQFTGQLVSRFPFGQTGAEATYPSIAGFKDAAGLTADPLGLAVATAEPKTDPAAPTTYKVQRQQQLQFNPPGLPMFKGGTTAFMGDYIDVQGQNFVAGPAGWKFNVAPSRAPVFHAVWTSNQDVRAPVDSNGVQHWDLYTPVSLMIGAGPGGGMLFDGGRSTPNVSNAAVPECVPGSTGSRDQNIYTSRITEGLQVSTPQNAKILVGGAPTGFVIAAANSTAQAMTVRFGAPVFAAAYAGGYRTGYASDFTVPTVDAIIAPFSSVHRTLFVQQGSSPDAAPVISVTVEEVGACGTACRSGALTFNPPVALATLAMPDGVATSPGSGEVYTAAIGAPNVSNPNVSNPNVSNPNVSNPNVSNPNVSNPNVSNPNVSNPNVSNVTISSPNVSNPNVSNPNVSNPNVSNPNVSNPNVSNPNVSNPNVSNPNVSNLAVSDASYTITNQGNTTASYHVKVVGDASQAPSPLQLIVSKTYKTPVAVGCDLKEVAHDQVVVSVPDVSGAIAKPTDAVSTGVADPNVSNATVALAPGESAVVTLRGFVPPTQMAKVAAALTPAPVPAKVPPTTTATYQDWSAVTGQAPLVKVPTVLRLNQDGVFTFASVAAAPGSPPGPRPTGRLTFIRTRAGADTVVGSVLIEAFGGDTPFLDTGLVAGDTVTVFYSGDGTYAASSSNAPGASLIPTKVTLSQSGGTTFASIDVAPGATPAGAIDGQVRFSSVRGGVTTVLGTVDLAAFLPGAPSLVTDPLPGDVIVAEYLGSGAYAPSSGSRTAGFLVWSMITAVPSQSIGYRMTGQVNVYSEGGVQLTPADVTASWSWPANVPPTVMTFQYQAVSGTSLWVNDGSTPMPPPGTPVALDVTYAGWSQRAVLAMPGPSTIVDPAPNASLNPVVETPVTWTNPRPDLVMYYVSSGTPSGGSWLTNDHASNPTNTASVWGPHLAGGGEITVDAYERGQVFTGTGADYLLSDFYLGVRTAVPVTWSPTPIYVDATYDPATVRAPFTGLRTTVCRSSGVGLHACYSDATVTAYYYDFNFAGTWGLWAHGMFWDPGTNSYRVLYSNEPPPGLPVTIQVGHWGQYVDFTGVAPETPAWAGPPGGSTFALGQTAPLTWTNSVDPGSYNLALNYDLNGQSMLAMAHPPGTARSLDFILSSYPPGAWNFTLQGQSAGSVPTGADQTSRFRLYSGTAVLSFTLTP